LDSGKDERSSKVEVEYDVERKRNAKKIPNLS